MPLTTRTFSSPNLRDKTNFRPSQVRTIDRQRQLSQDTPRHYQSDQQHLADFDDDEDDEFYVIGDRVYVDGYRPGSVAYFGETEFAAGDWVGVVLDNATGNHDGKLLGREYFQCAPNHGIFVRTHRISRIPESAFGYSRSLSRTPTPLPTYHNPLRYRNFNGRAPSHTPEFIGPSSRSSSRSPAASSFMGSYYYDDDYRREPVPTVASLAKKLESLSERHQNVAHTGVPPSRSNPLTGILKHPLRDSQTQTRSQSAESRLSSGYGGSGGGRGSAPLNTSQSEGLNGRTRLGSSSSNGKQFTFRPKREPMSSVDKSTYTDYEHLHQLKRPVVNMSSEPPRRGDRVMVKTDRNGGEELAGTLRYMGETSFATGEWAGVELDDPVGKNNGSILGQRYFYCPQYYGLFVPAKRVRKLDRNDYKHSYERPSVFESMRSTILSPPPPPSQMGANRSSGSMSTTPSYEMDANSWSSSKPSSPYIQISYQTPNLRQQKPHYDSSRSTLNMSSASSNNDLYKSSSLDKFDDRDLDREIRKSLNKSTGHNDWTNSAKPKGVTYTFISNKLNGNPIACKTLFYE